MSEIKETILVKIISPKINIEASVLVGPKEFEWNTRHFWRESKFDDSGCEMVEKIAQQYQELITQQNNHNIEHESEQTGGE